MSVLRPAGLERGPTLITDKLSHPMNFSMAKPARGNSYYDPAFGQKVTRITDVAAQFGGTICCTIYPTQPAWNADGSLLLLYVQTLGQFWTFLGSAPYTPVRNIGISPNDIESVCWSATNPALVFYVTGTTLKTHNVTTDAEVTQFTNGATLSLGNDPMYSSWDNDLWGFRVSSNGFTRRLSTSTTSSNIANSLADLPSPSGSLFVVAPTLGSGKVYDAATSTLQRTMGLWTDDHACMLRTTDGRDLWAAVQFNGTFEGAFLITENLGDGTITPWMNEAQGWPYPPSGVHVAAMAFQNPGVVVCSCIGNSGAGYNGILQQEVIAVNVNSLVAGSGLIGRLCHHHSIPQGVEPEPNFNYFSEPHPAVHPAGRKAVFASNWNSSQIDCYVVEW